MLYHSQGVPNLSTVALVPVFVLLAVRYSEGSLSTRRFVAFGAVALAAQYLISSETLAMTTVFGAIALALAYWQLPAWRAGLRRLIKAAPLAYAGCAVLISPFLWYVFFEPAFKPGLAVPETFSSDLLSFVFPAGVQELGDARFAALADTFGGDGAPFGGGGSAYLGLPLLLIAGLFAIHGTGAMQRRGSCC